MSPSLLIQISLNKEGNIGLQVKHWSMFDWAVSNLLLNLFIISKKDIKNAFV